MKKMMRTDRAGAALLIAIAIMTILLLVALSFFTVTRLQVNTSESMIDSLKASFLADAGTAIAMAFLNYDYAIHQMYTSTDHAWRTYFNGAWAAGKQWAWVNGVPLTAGGVPEIRLPDTGSGVPNVVPNIRQWFYVPRIQQSDPLAFDRVNNPFVLTSDYDRWPLGALLSLSAPREPDDYCDDCWWPEEQVDTFTDVDNDGDGHKDSIWLPIGADEFLNHDGIDNDLDGMIDEGAGSDDIDNDGDGAIDEPDELLDATNGPQAQSEACVFVYWGGNDGLDNNGKRGLDANGNPTWFDEVTDLDGNGIGEQRIYLTAPIRSPYGPAGTPGWLDGAPADYDGYLDVFTVTRFGVPYYVEPWPGSDSVDVIDNDWNVLANDHQEFFPVLGDRYSPVPAERGWYGYFDRVEEGSGPYGDAAQLAHTAHRINATIYLSHMQAIAGIYAIYSTGEPVCELVGRVAVLVNDESSKVNMNAAGGHTFSRERSVETDENVPAFYRTLADGAGPWEYETRVLPGIGIEKSSHLWALLTGAPKSQGFVLDRPAELPPDPADLAYAWDWSMPGYGRADDNGSALWMATDGVDNDGDGLIDEGFYVPPLPTREDEWDAAKWDAQTAEVRRYVAQLGMFEGIDEPQERRLYRAYRNYVAESDGIDTDGNDVVDEIGELGDRALGTREQLKLARRVAGGTFDDLKRFVTVNSSDPDMTYVHHENGLLPEVSGTRLDLNYARIHEGEVTAVPDITDALMRDWERHYRATKFYLTGEKSLSGGDFSLKSLQGAFAAGLRQEDVTLIGSPYDYRLANGEVAMTADNELRAYKLALTAKDFVDRDHRRSELTLFNDVDLWLDTWANAATGGQLWDSVRYTMAGIESIRINELMVRPVRRVEAEMLLPYSPIETALNATDLFDRDLQGPLYNPNYFGCQLDFSETSGTPNDRRAFWLSFDMIQSFPSSIPDLYSTDNLDALFAAWFPMPWRFAAYADMQGALLSGASGFALPGSVKMGDQCALTTSAQALEVPMEIPEGSGNLQTTVWPNMVQFRFGPSPGLPPGRYYLTMNTKDERGMPTIGPFDELGAYTGNLYNTRQIQYAIKYGAATDSILDDVRLGIEENWADPSLDPDRHVGLWSTNAKVGYEDMTYYLPSKVESTQADELWMTEARSGWVWLPSCLPSEADPATVGYDRDYAYTVRIPDYNPANQEYLYVAVRINRDLKNDTDGYLYSDLTTLEGSPPDYDAWYDSFSDYQKWYRSAYQQWHTPSTAPTLDPFHLSINFFDFSQEPDHEWVELTNIAEWDPNKPAEEQTIDVGGWYLELGAPEYSDANPKFYIPKGGVGSWSTKIAPGGMLLLGFNKYDHGADNSDTDLGHFARNGIGLTTNLPDGSLTEDPSDPLYISVPPTTFDELTGAIIDLADLSNPATDPLWTIEAGGSVFDPRAWYPDPDRPPYRDFVDVNGDGVRDLGATDDFVVSTEGDDPFNPVPMSKAWDRIVELDAWFPAVETAGGLASVLRLQDVGKYPADLDRVAWVVLRGGMLPNYPEHNRFDDDGDNLVLETDGVDNNGNNFIYERDGIDQDGDTDGTGNEIDPGEGIDEVGEGIDEGRRDTLGFYDPTGHFLTFYDVPGSFQKSRKWDRTYLASNWHYAPSWSISSSPLWSWCKPPWPQSITMFQAGGGVYQKELSYYGNYYYCSDENEDNCCDEDDDPSVPPEWRDFVERRWFPGDNVILTLRDETGGVVDSATYTERDVVNRVIDDRVPMPQCQNRMELWGDARDGLNVDYNTMWPENTMGVDFYRSLERKHPLYDGDRFGVQNRWQATDGRYDDWDDSLCLWLTPDEAALTEANRPTWSALRVGRCLMGSPLSMNFYQRRVEGEFATTEVLDDGFATADERAGLWRFQPQPDKVPKLGYIRNRPLNMPADIVDMPHFALRRNLRAPDRAWGEDLEEPSRPFGRLELGHTSYGLEANLGRGRYDYEYVDEVLLGDRTSGESLVAENPVAPSDSTLVPTALPVDLVALAGGGSGDPIVLSVAQAEPALLYRPGNAFATRRWDVEPADPDMTDATVNPYTQAFTPAYLLTFDLDVPPDADDRTTKAFFDRVLFEGSDYLLSAARCPGFVGADTNDLAEWVAQMKPRWQPATGPDLRRAVYYVGDFPSNRGVEAGVGEGHLDIRSPEVTPMALFAWRAEAGVENGTYDVYVALNDTLVDVRTARDKEVAEVARRVRAGLCEDPPRTTLPLTVFHDYTACCTGGAFDWSAAEPALLTAFGDWLLDNASYKNVRALVKFYTNPKYYRNANRMLDFDPGGDARLAEDELLEPGETGIAYYGSVTITDNFLAMRIRNWSNWEMSEVNPPILAFSRVILTPRDRVSGRINLNTASMSKVGEDVPGEELTAEVFNPLMGLPGLLREYDGNWEDEREALRHDDIALLKADYIENPTANLINEAGAKLYLRARSILGERPEWLDGRFYPYRGRPEWPDGRYYRSPADLLGYVPYFDSLDMLKKLGERDPRVLKIPATDSDAAEAVRSELTPDGFPTIRLSPAWYHPEDNGGIPWSAVEPKYTYPLIPHYREMELRDRFGDDLEAYGRQEFNESMFRYSRLYNLVTTRSDVFEIITTAQSGHGVDANGDGRINYRDPNEFIRTGQKTTRTVYNR